MKTSTEFLLQVAHTADLEPSVLAEARQLLYDVFDDMTEHDWDHSLGGMHVVAWHESSVVGHASVVQRHLFHGGRSLRAGYVEGVGVHPAFRGQGIGDLMMEALERIIRSAYDIGALGASDEAVTFYEHRGWAKWRGPTSTFTPTGVVRTPDEDGWIFVLPAAAHFDLNGDLTCGRQEGDVW